MDQWQGKRVIVTGGAGFLGSYLVPALQAAGASVFVPRSAQYDLTYHAEVIKMFATAGGRGAVDVLFHLAAVVGGIGANMQAPADFYSKNVLMNALMVDYSVAYEVRKFVGIGSVCQYPKFVPVPMNEACLWDGYPEETNAPYGMSKRGLLVHLQAARSQYGLNGIFLIPTNLYGPGDNYNPATSHVIPALIRRIDEAQRAGLDQIEVWGTGSASRDFLFVEDAAEALMLAAWRYSQPAPINLGSGEEICIAGLVSILAGVMGYTGQVVYNPQRPDGQPRRCLNTRRAWDAFGWKASTGLEAGLARTVEAWRRRQEVTP